MDVISANDGEQAPTRQHEPEPTQEVLRCGEAHLLLNGRGRSVSFRNVVTTSMRSLYAVRCESSFATMLAMRPTTKLKKKPLTIMVMIAQIFSASVVLLMSP